MKDNGLLVQYFNANTPADQTLWAKAAKDAVTLKKIGATAVWFPPATKGAAGKEDMICMIWGNLTRKGRLGPDMVQRKNIWKQLMR